MLLCPFPILRIPHWLSPRVYAGCVIWTLLGSNPLMLALAYRFEDPTIDSYTATIVLGAATILSLVGAGCTFALAPQNHRAGFYEYRTLAM